jgi:hypothetical protein
LISKNVFSDVGVYVDDPTIKLFRWICLSSDASNNVFDFVDSFVDSFNVLPFGIEDDFLFYMITVDEQLLVFVGFTVESNDAILKSKIQLEIIAKINHLCNTVDDHIFFGLKF